MAVWFFMTRAVPSGSIWYMARTGYFVQYTVCRAFYSGAHETPCRGFIILTLLSDKKFVLT